MLPIEYLPGARVDFDESFEWYSLRSTQTAIRFANAIDSALAEVAANPSRYVSIDGIHRECSVKKFPFRIVYRVVDAGVLVVAIAHAKRRTGYWKRRD
jgi:plasmid stabilization system protein ParE